MAWLADWFPLLLLIGVWLFFMFMMWSKANPVNRMLAEVRRRDEEMEALRRAIADHDARLRRLENDRNGQ
jgi:hypothetical protein